ncbi:MAG: dodecin family protein [Flavobacteriaceae bacterium]|nr:dodecin family protein [Flavobacteriaceae bacterium]
MSVLKVIEVLANSDKSWEDAAGNAVAHAAKSVQHIKSVFVDSQSAVVEGNLIKEYRVNVKITFEVN